MAEVSSSHGHPPASLAPDIGQDLHWMRGERCDFRYRIGRSDDSSSAPFLFTSNASLRLRSGLVQLTDCKEMAVSSSSAICGLLGPIINSNVHNHWAIYPLPCLSPFQWTIAEVQDQLFLRRPNTSTRLRIILRLHRSPTTTLSTASSRFLPLVVMSSELQPSILKDTRTISPHAMLLSSPVTSLRPF